MVWAGFLRSGRAFYRHGGAFCRRGGLFAAGGVILDGKESRKIPWIRGLKVVPGRHGQGDMSFLRITLIADTFPAFLPSSFQNPG